MNCLKWTLVGAVAMSVGSLACAATPELDDTQLSTQQKRDLRHLRSTMETLGKASSQTDEDKKLAVRDDLTILFSATANPSPRYVERLSERLIDRMGAGQVDLDQAMMLAKEMAKLLDSPGLHIDTALFKASVEPVVESTSLSRRERMAIYQDVVDILSSAGRNRR